MSGTGSAIKGRLYLVPTPLDFGCESPAPIEHALPTHTLKIASGLTHWICENAKSTRHFLNRVHAVQPLTQPLQHHTIFVLPRQAHKKGDHQSDPAQDPAMETLLGPCLAGTDMGLVSEAGMPAIADPGSSVVRAAHRLGLRVEPLVGPISLMLALACSGLNGQNFAFVGYLPVTAAERTARILQLQSLSQQTGQTQILIETPYRNQSLMTSLVASLAPTTRLAVLCGAGLDEQTSHSALVKQWRSAPVSLPLSLPTVFLFGST